MQKNNLLNLYIKDFIIIFSLYFLVNISLITPYIFESVINWDESVYILMGKALSEGHLPYTKVWDNKPPIGFIFYAIPQLFLKNSIFIIRIFLVFYVTVISYLCYLIAVKNQVPRSLAFFSGILTAGMILKITPGGNSLLLEHIAVIPLLIAFLIFKPLDKNDNFYTSNNLLIGFLFAISVLIRSNLGVALLLFFIIGALLNKNAIKTYFSIALSSGYIFFVITFLVFIIYYFNNNHIILLKTLFYTPLKYLSNNNGLYSLFRDFYDLLFSVRTDLGDRVSASQSFRTAFWIISALTIVYYPYWGKIQPIRAFLFPIVFGILISIVITGRAYDHYFIQIIPFCSLLIIFFLSEKFKLFSYFHSLSALLFFLFLSLSPFNLYYKSLEKILNINVNISNYELIANKVKYLKEGPIFSVNDPIIYFLSDSYPPIPIAAFPHNIFHEHGFISTIYGDMKNSSDLLNNIFLVNPPSIIILKSSNPRKYDMTLITKNINKRYHLEFNANGDEIYKLNSTTKDN